VTHSGSGGEATAAAMYGSGGDSADQSFTVKDKMDRTQEIRAYIDPATQRGVEIGPLDRPVVSSTEGEIVYLDYFTAQDLRRKHSNNPNVNCNLIVDVRQIADGKTLSQTLDECDSFDYVVASHVIEHVPDLIGWLQEVATTLKPRGIISLAIPDKRFTFDYLRTLSTPGDAIDAYQARLRRPSVRHVFDHYVSAVLIDPVAAWRSSIDPAQLTHYHSAPVAWQLALAAQGGEYVDAHVWVFTPDSFLALLKLFAELGLIDLDVIRFVPTAPNTIEFFITLQKRG
jgi:SAM-dependent methyltransferase